MSLTAPALFRLTPEAFWFWGRTLLWSGFAFVLLILAYLTWAAPDLVLLLPLLPLGGLIAGYLYRHPLLNLCVVLSGFVLILRYEAGIQLTEALYGLYYFGFLAHWFVTRGLVYRDPILRRPEEKALFLFLVLMTLSFLLTMLFGGSLRSAFSEWIALSMLALYFPVKEACVRYRQAPKIILIIVCWIGLFVALRNVAEYQFGLQSAENIYDITQGRVYTNDSIMAVLSLFALTLLVFAERWTHRLPLLFLFLFSLAGLIVTQSRGYWVAFAFGAFAMFLLVEGRYKGRLLVLGMSGLGLLLGLGMLFFGDYVTLITSGLLSRFLSIGTAITQDISLRSRFVEAAAALEYVKESPILGHGMGVSFQFFDIISERTLIRTLIHNGYVSLWYRFGLWGLFLVSFFCASTIWRGVQTFRRRPAPPLLRICGLASAVSLLAIALANNTSNAFFLNDSTFIVGLLLGLAGGVYERTTRVHR